MPGIYRGACIYNKRTTLIVANELRNTEHNASLKLFASREQERDKAFTVFQGPLLKRLSSLLEKTVVGLWNIYQLKGGFMKRHEITIDDIDEMGWGLIKMGIRATPPKQVIEELGKQSVIQVIDTKDFVKEKGTKEIVKEMGTKEIVKEMGTKEIVREMGIEKIVSEVGVEEIEAYLKELKAKQS